jgi:hypothetical protein
MHSYDLLLIVALSGAIICSDVQSMHKFEQSSEALENERLTSITSLDFSLIPIDKKKFETGEIAITNFKNRLENLIADVTRNIKEIGAEIKSGKNDKLSLMAQQNELCGQEKGLVALKKVISKESLERQDIIILASEAFTNNYYSIVWPSLLGTDAPYADWNTINRVKLEAIYVAQFLLELLGQDTVESNDKMETMDQLSTIIETFKSGRSVA